MSDYLGPLPASRYLGPVDASPLIDFIDEPRHWADWQDEAERAERNDHAALLRSIGVLYVDRRAAWRAQRVQALGTLEGLHGARV